MSKEATAQLGVKLGSSEYWSRINRDTLFGDLLGSGTDYRSALGKLGARARDTIEDIYDDLSELGSKIRYLPSSDRNALAKQVEGLYDVCRLGGVSAGHSSECVQGLNLSIMSPWNRSFRDERGIEKAISFINHSPYSAREALDLLREASLPIMRLSSTFPPEAITSRLAKIRVSLYFEQTNIKAVPIISTQ